RTSATQRNRAATPSPGLERQRGANASGSARSERSKDLRIVKCKAESIADVRESAGGNKKGAPKASALPTQGCEYLTGSTPISTGASQAQCKDVTSRRQLDFLVLVYQSNRSAHESPLNSSDAEAAGARSLAWAAAHRVQSATVCRP